MFVVDDSDMKIVKPQGDHDYLADDGEKAAMEYLAQKANGNIEKAHDLAKSVAEAFFASDGPVTSLCGKSEEKAVILQRKVLFAFVAELVFHTELASVVAEAAEQDLIARIREKDSDTIGLVEDSKTRSYYLLGSKKGRAVPYENMGKAFAKLCGSPDDPALCQLGQCLTEQFAHFCANKVKEARFV